jgi:hypothetical protein
MVVIWIWKWPPIINLRTARNAFIELAKYCYTSSASFETAPQKY